MNYYQILIRILGKYLVNKTSKQMFAHYRVGHTSSVAHSEQLHIIVITPYCDKIRQIRSVRHCVLISVGLSVY